MKLGVRWIAMLAAMSLLYLPLRAQETPPETPAAASASEQAAQEPVEEPEEEVLVEAEEAEDEPDAYEERVSVDNNLSFPVDI